MADIIIDIASEFTGKKAFKQAESSTDSLMKNVKKLAKTLGVAYGTTQILAFGKTSIRAAAADQKAQQQLALALKNVGLGRDAATSEGYIQRLQSEFGIVDDLLRPSYQTLAVATRDTTEAQRLMGIALDVSAANALDLSTVSKALSKAYLGNNTALSKLGVGISKTDLKTKSFKEITDQLALTFAGAATTAANSYQGSLDKLAVASANFKESIGTGLIEALQVLSGDQGLGSATSAFEKYGKKISDATVGTAYLLEELKKIPGASLALSLLSDPLGINTLLTGLQKYKQEPRPFRTPMTISGQTEVKTAKAVTNLAKQQATAQSKILKDKKAQIALDNANLALNKATGVFDMDKIQIAAALTSQAEALGKATTSSQVLQIANDTARLNVKQSILALEDAIAAKDEAAIIASTNKLNADLKVLGALGMQNLKLLDIKSLLESLVPKDLINLANLNEALRLLGLINLASTGSKTTSASKPSTAPSTAALSPATTIAETNANVAALAGIVTQIQPNLKEFTPNTGMISGIGPNGREYNYSVNVYANTIANPDELTNLIQDSLIRLNKRGDYITTAGSL